ncbi:MAG: heme ABC transporter ATP-binding protein [Thiotrichales bacterium]
MLRANGISVRIGSRWLIRNITLSVEPGNFVAVVGPNGAGKSTLLRALSGEIAVTEGAVEMNGQPLAQISLRDRARVRAVLPQHSALNFPFRSIDVVAMGRDPALGCGAQHDRTIVTEALAAADAAHLAERDFTTLSGGEQQRVHLARVLAQIWEPAGTCPRYLLLDEPTSALDLAHQHHCLGVAQRFAWEQGIGVLAILHDLNLAACYADQIVMLADSFVLARGTPREVILPHRIREAFGIEVAVLDHPLLNDRPLVVTAKPVPATRPEVPQTTTVTFRSPSPAFAP